MWPQKGRGGTTRFGEVLQSPERVRSSALVSLDSRGSAVSSLQTVEAELGACHAWVLQVLRA